MTTRSGDFSRVTRGTSTSSTVASQLRTTADAGPTRSSVPPRWQCHLTILVGHARKKKGKEKKKKKERKEKKEKDKSKSNVYTKQW